MGKLHFVWTKNSPLLPFRFLYLVEKSSYWVLSSCINDVLSSVLDKELKLTIWYRNTYMLHKYYVGYIDAFIRIWVFIYVFTHWLMSLCPQNISLMWIMFVSLSRRTPPFPSIILTTARTNSSELKFRHVFSICQLIFSVDLM